MEVKQKTVEVPCFDTECETICIPPVRFPWECGPLRRCGKVRRVNRLVLDTREETVCQYNWSAKLLCCPQCRQQRCQNHHRRCHAPNLSLSSTPDGLQSPVATDDAWRDYFQDPSEELSGDNVLQATLIETLEQTEPQPDGWVVADNPFSD